MGKQLNGKEIRPKEIRKVKKGNFYVPECPDYEPRIHISVKVKREEVLAGWHCYNCKNFKEE